MRTLFLLNGLCNDTAFVSWKFQLISKTNKQKRANSKIFLAVRELHLRCCMSPRLISNKGLKYRCFGVVATFWGCNCNIAATFILFLLPVSTGSIFGSISTSLPCSSLMIFIPYLSIVWLFYFFKLLSLCCRVSTRGLCILKQPAVYNQVCLSIYCVLVEVYVKWWSILMF